MARKGLYANIHAKRKRGETMKKKGAKRNQARRIVQDNYIAKQHKTIL